MPTRRIAIATFVCLAAVGGLLAVAWPGGTARGRAAGPVKLFVHAGAGIQPPLDELGTRFTQLTGIQVEYSYKGSGCLLPDICVSRKGDLYIPGELFYMDQAVERGIISEFRPVAQMSTVLIAQASNPKRIKSVKDLARPGMRVGLGDAKAIAVGRAARSVLEKARVRQAVEKNTVMSCMNVVELGNAVKLGHLDAAIVWDGTAALYGRQITTIPIPSAYRVTTTIPCGVLKFSKQAAAARRFMDFLASKEAEPIFRKHGYMIPRDKARTRPRGGKP